MIKKSLFALNIQLFAENPEDKPESEIVKFLKEEYEKKLADKDKIIKDLITQNKKKKTNAQSIIEDEDEDVEDKDENVEEKKKQEDEEKRRNSRMDYYKKHIY